MFLGLKKCKISTNYFDLTLSQRRLWYEHIGWTRLAIISLVDGSPDTEFVLARLLQNPIDFEEFFLPLYGPKAAAEFASLLTEHLEIAAILIPAIKDGDSCLVKDSEQRWHENAKEIARFLNHINPCLSEKEFLAMFNQHLALIEAAAVYRINGNYQRQVKMFDLLEIQGIDMADMLISAIAEQFPEKYNCR